MLDRPGGVFDFAKGTVLREETEEAQDFLHLTGREVAQTAACVITS